jgi:hypothetical protein
MSNLADIKISPIEYIQDVVTQAHKKAFRVLYIINFDQPLSETVKAAIKAEFPDEICQEIVECVVPCQFNLSEPLRPQVKAAITLALGFINTNNAWGKVAILPPQSGIAAYWIGAAFVTLDMTCYEWIGFSEDEDEHQIVSVTPAVWLKENPVLGGVE